MILALFDFDGTITNKDTLIEFIKFVHGRKRLFLGLLHLSPILILYKLKLIPNYKAKEILFSYFFKGFSEDQFKKAATAYSLSQIDSIVKEKARQRLLWHKNNGHKIVIVSASIDCWLRPWCEKNGFDLIATKLEIKNGKLTGKFMTKNCYGPEKVNRIREVLDLSKFSKIYAYGDSKGDYEMLQLAQERFYRCF